jgi:hypothetical protein
MNKNFLLRHEPFVVEHLTKHFDIPESYLMSNRFVPGVDTGDIYYGALNIFVKTSNPVIINKEKKEAIWDFDFRNIKLRGEHDHYLLLGLKDNEPDRLFLIPPWVQIPSHIRISITGSSIYEQYEI